MLMPTDIERRRSLFEDLDQKRAALCAKGATK
jgi:hypothetical protein